MTSENTMPPAEMEPSGQSHGHRRRRRRRKNKGGSAGAAAMNGSAPAPQEMPPPPTQAGVGQGRRKKKKKFGPSGGTHATPRPPRPEPGNSIHPMGQGKKKRQQRGPREFVGPMDHSYRTVNGNVADTPASTIPVYNSGSGYYEGNYAPPSPPMISGSARIFCFIEDLFFTAKINETSKKLGIKVDFIKGDKDGIARLLENEEEVTPHLIVFDLNNVGAKPLTLIPKLKSKYKKSVSIIGFLSHVQGDLKMKASEAGCDTVMPRSAFSQSLPNLLRRYGIDDDDDHYQQPM